MRMQLVLHPDWERQDTRSFCEGLPEQIPQLGQEQILYQARNVLYRCAGPDGEVVIKWFAARGWWKKLQRCFRSSKAPRSFAVARRLQELSIATPTPLAWYERFRTTLQDAAYICRYSAGEQVRTLYFREDPERLEPIRACGAFVAELHRLGVRHRDLTPGNILFAAGPSGGWHFELIDLNRVRFGAPLVGAVAIRNMVNLEFQGEARDSFLAGYGGGDPSADLLAAYDRAMQRNLIHRRRKKWLRELRRRLGLKK